MALRLGLRCTIGPIHNPNLHHEQIRLMDIRQLAALRAIAETGTFYGAAQRLHRTQSAISHQIKSLEGNLGETLIVRSKPRVVLSEAGRRVLLSSGRILAEVEALRKSF